MKIYVELDNDHILQEIEKLPNVIVFSHMNEEKSILRAQSELLFFEKFLQQIQISIVCIEIEGGAVFLLKKYGHNDIFFENLSTIEDYLIT